MKQRQGVHHLLGKKVSQSKRLFEFIGPEEFPVIAYIGPKYKGLVKRKALPFPAGKTTIPLRNKRAAAGQAAPLFLYFKAPKTLAAETVPGLLRVKKRTTADSAACGKDVLPEQRYKAADVFHEISIAGTVRDF
jgi:hypothetical protein